MTNTFKILKEITILFDKNKIFYIIGGNTGLILQNVKIKDDKEIDICTNKAGAYKVQELLDKFTIDKTKYKKLEWFKAHWGIFKIKDITIEIMGNPKIKFKDGTWQGLPKKNITSIIFNNKRLNVFTLESEYKYYKKISYNKPEKKEIADKIKKTLQ